MRLTGVSFSHPEFDSARRADLTFPSANPGGEIFFLATCLRVEVAWVGDTEAEIVLEGLYGPQANTNWAAIRHDAAAFLHLSRVAAGLDSPLIGEPEVLGQFRQAIASLDHPTSLNRVMQATVAVARSVRRELGEVPRGSLASVAASRVDGRGPVAILGGGAMAKAAIEALPNTDITVFTRRGSPVAGHRPHGWRAVGEAVANFPTVISTVPGKTPVLSPEQFTGALAMRDDPLLLIDLGMPPAFAPPIGDGRVRYLGIDEIAATVTSSTTVPAEAAIESEAKSAWQGLTAPDRAASVIAALMQSADTAVAEEVSRFAPRLADSDDPESVLRQAVHTAARRILHPAVSYLGSADDESVDVVAEAFEVDR